jgi:DNA-binding IclR family transcriptional regulator
VEASTLKSPPTRRVVEILDALAVSPNGRTSAELARCCGITTSTCALILAELERAGWVTRRVDRRYGVGSGLLSVVHALREQFPLLDRGRDTLSELHERLNAGCSMSRIGDRQLTTVDSVGHGTDGQNTVGQRFPIDPPFGLVAMAWRDDAAVDDWLRRVTPRLNRSDIAAYKQVLRDIRARGYGAWRFDDPHASLHDRLTSVLSSLEQTDAVARQLTALMTMVTLKSVTKSLERDLATTEFVVLPVFGPSGQPEYQIEIRLGQPDALTLNELDGALAEAQGQLAPAIGSADSPQHHLRQTLRHFVDVLG